MKFSEMLRGKGHTHVVITDGETYVDGKRVKKSYPKVRNRADKRNDRDYKFPAEVVHNGRVTKSSKKP